MLVAILIVVIHPNFLISYKSDHTATSKSTLLLLPTTPLRLVLPPHIPPNHNIRPRHTRHQQNQQTRPTQHRLQPTRPHIFKQHKTHESVLATEEIQRRPFRYRFFVQLRLGDDFAGRFASESHAAPAVGVERCVAEGDFEVGVFGAVGGEGEGDFGRG
jgi:hypothetical protein